MSQDYLKAHLWLVMCPAALYSSGLPLKCSIIYFSQSKTSNREATNPILQCIFDTDYTADGAALYIRL